MVRAQPLRRPSPQILQPHPLHETQKFFGLSESIPCSTQSMQQPVAIDRKATTWFHEPRAIRIRATRRRPSPPNSRASRQAPPHLLQRRPRSHPHPPNRHAPIRWAQLSIRPCQIDAIRSRAFHPPKSVYQAPTHRREALCADAKILPPRSPGFRSGGPVLDWPHPLRGEA